MRSYGEEVSKRAADIVALAKASFDGGAEEFHVLVWCRSGRHRSPQRRFTLVQLLYAFHRTGPRAQSFGWKEGWTAGRMVGRKIGQLEGRREGRGDDKKARKPANPPAHPPTHKFGFRGRRHVPTLLLATNQRTIL